MSRIIVTLSNSMDQVLKKGAVFGQWHCVVQCTVWAPSFRIILSHLFERVMSVGGDVVYPSLCSETENVQNL